MKISHWLSTFLVPLACASCAAVTDGEGDGEGETEPSGATQDELRSAVSCAEKPATGYKGGSPYGMSVITVGGKLTAKPTAHAFLKMQAAADKAGVTLSINSGFRSMAEQQHLYSCYQTKKCNNGNLAARPGFSNHQNGRALDLATGDWTWVANNAAKYGFKRTVPSERWHYEFFGADPGGPCSGGGATVPTNGTPGSTPTNPAPSNPAPSNPAPSDPPDDGDPDPGATPTPPAPPPAEPNAPAGGCYSPTTGKTMAPGACVRSSADDVTYQCHETLWYRGVTGSTGPYGACTSKNF